MAETQAEDQETQLLEPESAAEDKNTDPQESVVPASPCSEVAGSVVPKLNGKPVEAFSWPELNVLPAAVQYCQCCGQVVQKTVASEAQRKKGHAKLMCPTCKNITSTLYKRCNMEDLKLKEMDPDQAGYQKKRIISFFWIGQ